MDNAEKLRDHYQRKQHEIEGKCQLMADSYNKVLLEMSNLKAENSRIPGLEDKVKTLTSAVSAMSREKKDLHDLMGSLREQINDMEDEKSNAKEDETLMREKLKYVMREKEILQTKVKKLEGMYESELGEVKNAEDVVKALKQTQLELDYLRKNDLTTRKEKEELRAIIQGLRGQIDAIEGQRDHFENQHEKLNQEIEGIKSGKQSGYISQKESIHVMEYADDDTGLLKIRVGALEREKAALEEENREIQERLDEHIERLYKGESNSTHSANSQRDAISSDSDRGLYTQLKTVLKDGFGYDSVEAFK